MHFDRDLGRDGGDQVWHYGFGYKCGLDSLLFVDAEEGGFAFGIRGKGCNYSQQSCYEECCVLHFVRFFFGLLGRILTLKFGKVVIRGGCGES